MLFLCVFYGEGIIVPIICLYTLYIGTLVEWLVGVEGEFLTTCVVAGRAF